MLSRNREFGSISRIRILSRKPKIRPTEDSDIRYLWAAYQSGMWPELFDANLPQNAFRDRLMEVLGSADYDWIIEARGDSGNRPVALVMARAMGGGRLIEPHVDWFPWATGRNKLEGAVAFFEAISKLYKLMVFVSESDTGFYERLRVYRMIRRGCQIVDYFDRGEHAMLYYTAGP